MLILSNLYTEHRVQTRDPEIKSPVPHRLYYSPAKHPCYILPHILQLWVRLDHQPFG